MNQSETLHWRSLVNAGLLAGVVVVYTGLIGMIEVFSARGIITGVISLAELLILAPPLIAGFVIARRTLKTSGVGRTVFNSIVVGLISSLLPILLIFIITFFDVRTNVNIRNMFVNASTDLVDLLTFGLGVGVGSLALMGAFAFMGILGGVMMLLPIRIRGAVMAGLAWTLSIGMLGDLVNQILRNLFGKAAGKAVFTKGALDPAPALVIFVVAALLTYLWSGQRDNVRARYNSMGSGGKTATQRIGGGLLAIFLLMLPWILGTYLSEVLSNIGLYVLMALGLNIAVGLAGLLDLGYVTNFAVGAYTMGVLTSTGPLGRLGLNFWMVLPIAVLAAMFTGFVLALPVLRMRGDYLAIATLGFGEIIRILALSDWLSPLIGGAQGVLFIPKPSIGGFVFDTPQSIYYIILFASFLMLFISLRLNNSRTGRKWMAMREDEDAAGAMGIDTTVAKLLAFTLSAASGGLAGAIFASKLGTIFPHSFSLLISINVLSIIIVGGMGSIPGVIVGAVVLIGMPELLREFSEFRLLLYGALLITMMLVRPEGLWPSAVRRRELAHDEAAAAAVGD